MVQPTDYRMQYVDPAQAMMQGLQGAQTMQMNRQLMQVNDQAIQENQYKLAEMQRQQQQALARKAAYDARRTELLDGANDTDYLRNAVRLRSEFPEFNAGADAALKEMGETRRRQTYQTAMQVRSLVSAKKHEAAKDLLMQQAAALRNSGDEQNAKATEALAQAMIESPDLAPRIAANVAAITMDAKDASDFLKGEAEAGKVVSDIGKTVAETGKITAETGEVAANAAATRADMTARQNIARGQLAVNRATAAAAIANSEAAKKIAQANLDMARTRLVEAQRVACVQSVTAQQKQDDRTATGLAQAEGFDDMSAKVVELLADKNLDAIVGVWDGITPNLSPGARSAQAKLDTIKSAIFLTISPTLTGTQTAQDAADMKKAWAAIETAQDPAAFRRELKKIGLRAAASAARARKQYALPDVQAAGATTGGQPAAAPTASYMQLVK